MPPYAHFYACILLPFVIRSESEVKECGLRQQLSWKDDAGIVQRLMAAGFDTSACSIERLPSFPSKEEFIEQYVLKQKPVIITNVSHLTVGLVEWGNRSNFVKQFGKSQRLVRWPLGANQMGMLVRRSSIERYVAGMKHPASGMLFDEGVNVGLAGSWANSPFFSALGLDHSTFSVAPSRRGLPFHNHASAWEGIVVGRKLFFIMPPFDDEPWAPQPKDLSKMLLPSLHDFILHHLATFKTDFPALHSKIQSCVLKEGEAIYIPCNWYHATMNIGTSLAVGAQVCLDLVDWMFVCFLLLF
jgi:hypothetical protein